MPNKIDPFDNPFFTLLPAPPLGMLDTCFSSWVQANQLAYKRAAICQLYGSESQACITAREKYYEAARLYASCLDDVWGNNEF